MVSASERLLDPNLEEVLRDVARDPRAHLFHTTPRQLADGFHGHVPRISSRQAALTNAERHLLDVYREEVAGLLRLEWRRGVDADPVAGATVHKHVTVDGPAPLLTRAECEVRLRGLREQEASDQCATASVEVIERWLIGAGRLMPRRALLEAAFRLVHSDALRLCRAYEHTLMREWQEALELLTLVARGPSTDQNRSLAWESIGFCYTEMGRLPEALEAYRAAAQCGGLRPNPTASWLVLACVERQRREALQAADQLDTIVRPDHAALSNHLRVLSHYRSPGRAGAGWDAKHFAQQLHERVGPASRRILDGLY